MLVSFTPAHPVVVGTPGVHTGGRAQTEGEREDTHLQSHSVQHVALPSYPVSVAAERAAARSRLYARP